MFPKITKINPLDDGVQVLKNKLNSIEITKENEQIFKLTNSIIDLLKTKNQTTVDELNFLKSKYKKLENENRNYKKQKTKSS